MTIDKVFVVEGLYLYSDGHWIVSMHRNESVAAAKAVRLNDAEEKEYGYDKVDRIYSVRPYDLED